MLNVMYDFIKNWCLLLCDAVSDLDRLSASLSRRGSNPVKAIQWSWHTAVDWRISPDAKLKIMPQTWNEFGFWQEGKLGNKDFLVKRVHHEVLNGAVNTVWLTYICLKVILTLLSKISIRWTLCSPLVESGMFSNCYLYFCYLTNAFIHSYIFACISIRIHVRVLWWQFIHRGFWTPNICQEQIKKL